MKCIFLKDENTLLMMSFALDNLYKMHNELANDGCIGAEESHKFSRKVASQTKQMMRTLVKRKVLDLDTSFKCE